MMQKDALMAEIRALSFALVEANLYLDAYPEDKEALAYFLRVKEELKKKTEAYERAFGALTVMGVGEGGWSWTDTPWPWESED